ncbi:hypothetical protein [Succinimonas sp.]|uniref:hypothetical protein n=1 Tax=Succinimonas sp. TaxID=1936151 RepID=UPI00386D1460
MYHETRRIVRNAVRTPAEFIPAPEEGEFEGSEEGINLSDIMGQRLDEQRRERF